MLNEFVQFCRENIEHSFAQNMQDLFALWVAGGATSGYFVEFGALNGRNFSNTYSLEQIGWTGIVAEPHPAYLDKVPAVRRCHFSPLCVYDRTGETMTFRVVKGRPALSGLAATQLEDDKSMLRENYEEVQVKTITLDDLLDAYEAPSVIDYISIDTEGSELKILEAFNFKRRTVRSFCIEHNFAQRDALADLMDANGYRRVLSEVSGHDDWWILESLPLTPPRTAIRLADFMSEEFDTGLEARKALLDKLAQAAG